MNDQGVHFPIFGICLGLEALIYTMAGRSDSVLVDCNAQDYKAPLEFEPGKLSFHTYACYDITRVRFISFRESTAIAASCFLVSAFVTVCACASFDRNRLKNHSLANTVRTSIFQVITEAKCSEMRRNLSLTGWQRKT